MIGQKHFHPSSHACEMRGGGDPYLTTIPMQGQNHGERQTVERFCKFFEFFYYFLFPNYQQKNYSPPLSLTIGQKFNCNFIYNKLKNYKLKFNKLLMFNPTNKLKIYIICFIICTYVLALLIKVARPFFIIYVNIHSYISRIYHQ